ncbi:MAG: DUF2726 domain-containing protein [Chromatiales bacterium]|nr:DUF2726 domain-containing protein [Chromatiales bacterium]
MNILILLALVILILVVVAAMKSGAKGSDKGPWPFYARKPLTVPEQVLYFRLLKAFPDNIVLAQVGLSRMLGVKKGNNFRTWTNRIDRMSADFVICRKDSSIIAVIELDDASHTKPQRKIADAKKDQALGAAGIPIFRWQAKELPDEGSLRSTLGPLQELPGEMPLLTNFR